MLLLSIICSLYLFSVNPCEVERNNPEIEKIISDLKIQLNIYSISCSFTSIREPLIDHFNIIRNFDFAYEKGNFYLGVYRDDEKKKKSIKIPSSNNLLNLITKKISESEEDTDDITPRRFMEGYYLYQNNPYARIFYKKGKDILIGKLNSPPSPNKDNPENFNPHSTLGNPLWLIGYIGFYTPSNTLTDLSKIRYIPEFLEKEGKYYLDKRDDFTILWHEAKYEDGEVLSAEFWINKEGRLQKIFLGEFPARSYDWDKIRSIVGPDREFNCDSFSSIDMKIEFEEYKVFNNNVCIPMTGIFSFYVPDDEDAKNYESITEQYMNKKIDYLELLIMTEKLKMNYAGSLTLKIHPDTIIINQEIDDSIFIPPLPNFSWETYNQNQKVERTEKLHKGNQLTILLCVAFCIVCIVITRRYFRWGI